MTLKVRTADFAQAFGTGDGLGSTGLLLRNLI